MTKGNEADLEARVAHLEMMQDLLLRLMSTTRPLASVCEQFGATRSQEEALLKFLDSLVDRLRSPSNDPPSLPYFEMQVSGILPTLRGNREFFQLLVDTLQVERPAYRELHDYILGEGWDFSPEA